MANTLKKVDGHKYVISMQSETDPTEYIRIGIVNTSVSLASSFDFQETAVPDLDDFGKPYTIVRTIKSHDYKVEGSGLIDGRYIADLLDYHHGDKKGQEMGLKIQQMVPSGGGGYTITGDFFLGDINETATYGEAAECQLSWLKGNSDLTYTRGTITP